MATDPSLSGRGEAQQEHEDARVDTMGDPSDSLTAGNWMPIATAPKDEDASGLSPRIILGFAPDEENYTLPSCEGYWRRKSASHTEGWVSSLDGLVPEAYLKPTHWQPLPPPPVE